MGKSTFAFTTSSIMIDGGSTTINIACGNQSYSHKLYHGFGDIATLSVGIMSYTWKPTAAQLMKFWEEVPNQKTRRIDVTLDTYDGSTLVGSDRHALTVTLSEATGKPTLTSFTVVDSNAMTSSLGIWVGGKSYQTESNPGVIRGSWKFGSRFARSLFHVGSPFSNGGDFPTAVHALNGAAEAMEEGADPVQVNIEGKIKDSRDFWSDALTNKYYVAKYKAPHIDVFEVLRCNSSGTEDDAGTKAKITIKGGWAAMKVGTAYKNAATLKVGYRVKGSNDSYTFQSISVSGGNIDISQLLNVTLNSNTNYEFSIILSDTFSEADSMSEVRFSNLGNLISISADGKNVAFKAEHISFDCNNLSGELCDWIVSQGASGNWYYRKWASGKAEAMMWMKHRLTSWTWWNTNSYIKYGMPTIPDVALPFKFVTIYCTMRTTSNRIDDNSETFVVGGHLDSDHTKWVGGYICSPSGDIDRIVDTDIQFYISGTWK